MTELKHIQQNISETDTILNNFIEDFINNKFYSGTEVLVSEWRIASYTILRKWAYPDITIYNDAQVKINSGITALEEEGEEQLDDYVTDCLAVKTRFPKE